MSNPAVGNVYQAIIDEVVNSSRVDFEESGVEESVLEELRQGWQQKLTQLHVAQFPWDPKPDPPAQAPPSAVPPAQTHAQAQFSPQLSNPTGLSLPGMAQPQVQNGIKPEGNNIKTEPHVPIKQEPGLQAADGNLHELGRVEIDRMLHEQILAKAKSMEGGGLMLPLKEATRTSKCTLKDGVLTVNGKEYVFHKATGEYEW
ncbi:hypothetical protein ACJA88_004204 [Fusarium oxysporum]